MIVPSSGTSTPAIIFKRVDLPVPLTPIIPIFSPSLIPSEISLSKIFLNSSYLYFLMSLNS